jgi:hypothetical protein
MVNGAVVFINDDEVEVLDTDPFAVSGRERFQTVRTGFGGILLLVRGTEFLTLKHRLQVLGGGDRDLRILRHVG